MPGPRDRSEVRRGRARGVAVRQFSSVVIRNIHLRRTLMALVVWLSGTANVWSAEPQPCQGAGCAAALDAFFAEEVWAKVGEQQCLKCHKPGGDAESSKFVLRDTQRTQAEARVEAM